MAKPTLATFALAASLALPLSAHAGGSAPGGPPSGWGGYDAPSAGKAQPDRDRISDSRSCSNKIICPRKGSYEKHMEKKPKPRPDPVEEVKNPGGGIPETPTRPERPGKPGTPAKPTEPAPVSPVPLPAAGWALLAALGGLAAVRRRK